MKYLRLGYSETTLLFIRWLELNKHNELKNKKQLHYLHNGKRHYINWLYTTSGFYDKTVRGHYFNFSVDEADSFTYKRYLDLLMNIVKDSDVLDIRFHLLSPEIDKYQSQFVEFLRPRIARPIDQDLVYAAIANKRVLVVSSFAKLIKLQIISGNCKRIYPQFPEIISVIDYTTPYTFFNKGPDYNILETATRINSEIARIADQYDVAVVSFGAYTCLIADAISKHKKDVVCPGGAITTLFGIYSQRLGQEDRQLPNSRYWITQIPDNFKPKNYHLIEGGCYW